MRGYQSLNIRFTDSHVQQLYVVVLTLKTSSSADGLDDLKMKNKYKTMTKIIS